MKILTRRLLMAIPTLLVLPLLIFLLLELAPGDAAMTVLDPSASQDVADGLRAELGLTQSLAERYVRYLGGVLSGDLGRSVRSGTPVLEEIALRLPYTLALIAASVALGLFCGVLIGVLGAFNAGGRLDYALTAFISLSMAVPGFWLALILVGIFALGLRWLPVFGAESVAHLVLPAICTAFALIPGIARVTRTSILELRCSAFVTVAHAKGLPSSLVLRRHISPIAAIPVLTYVGMQIVHLFTSVVVMETIFAWPGLGGLAVRAALDRDGLLLQGVALVIALLTFALMLIVDVLVLWLDPRITLEAV